MQNYKELSLDKAYRLLNVCPLILVSSVSKDGQQNIAPVAWACPLEMEPTRVMFVLDEGHQTAKNILDNNSFIVSIPGQEQIDIIKKTGSISGKDVDKFEKFSLKSFAGTKSDCLIPEGVLGYIECKLLKTFNVEGSQIIIGEAVHAAADKNTFSDRYLIEKKDGRPLHHLGGKKFMISSGDILG